MDWGLMKAKQSIEEAIAHLNDEQKGEWEYEEQKGSWEWRCQQWEKEKQSSSLPCPPPPLKPFLWPFLKRFGYHYEFGSAYYDFDAQHIILRIIATAGPFNALAFGLGRVSPKSHMLMQTAR